MRLITMTVFIVMLTLAFSLMEVEFSSDDVPGNINATSGQGVFGFSYINGTGIEFESENKILSTLFSSSGLLVVILLGGAIIAGLLFRSQVESYVILGILLALFVGLIYTFYGVANTTISTISSDFIKIPLQFFLVGLIIMYIMTIIQEFRGNT